jgi:hypothetical protein
MSINENTISFSMLQDILGVKDYKKFRRQYHRHVISGGTMEKPDMVEFTVPIIGKSPLVCDADWLQKILRLKGGCCHG